MAHVIDFIERHMSNFTLVMDIYDSEACQYHADVKGLIPIYSLHYTGLFSMYNGIICQTKRDFILFNTI